MTAPNILFVFADQMRGMDMGCAGNPDVRTPAMDSLAADGTLLPNTFANCPVCTPSRGTILTGRYPLSHRALANDLPLPADETTIADVLSAAGYRTGYVGKWHLDGVPRDRFTPPGPRRQGFGYWAVWNCAHAYFGGKVYRDAPEPIALEGYEPVGQTDLACEFLRQDDDRPFCLFLSWGPPHAPYDKVPEKYRDMYEPDAITLRPNFAEEQLPGFRPLGRTTRRTLADYYAAITALDDQLARLLAVLEETGRADDTIVVFTSDHGDMLGSHGMAKKEQPWDEAVRIPLLIRWPQRIPAGRAAQNVVSTVDFMPTLLSLAGAEVPGCVEGRDLADVCLGASGSTDGEDALLTEPIIVDQAAAQGLGEWRGLRTRRYTYARWRDGRPWVLYDNAADPYQMTNLADSPAHDVLRGELDRRLQRRLEAIGDPGDTWDDVIRSRGLVKLWNERERYMHPRSPRLVDAE